MKDTDPLLHHVHIVREERVGARNSYVARLLHRIGDKAPCAYAAEDSRLSFGEGLTASAKDGPSRLSPASSANKQILTQSLGNPITWAGAPRPAVSARNSTRFLRLGLYLGDGTGRPIRRAISNVYAIIRRP